MRDAFMSGLIVIDDRKCGSARHRHLPPVLTFQLAPDLRTIAGLSAPGVAPAIASPGRHRNPDEPQSDGLGRRGLLHVGSARVRLWSAMLSERLETTRGVRLLRYPGEQVWETNQRSKRGGR